LRQLYYQLVTRNIITNTERSYKNLGQLVSQGRLAGKIDWSAIEDRLRVLDQVASWLSPSAIMGAVLSGYRLPRWIEQDQAVELWCEKDALAGVLQPITNDLDVGLMVNRGYSSQSAMKDAAGRLIGYNDDGKDIRIFYIGDQDPSGEDMVRDIYDRLKLLTRYEFSIDVEKIAITEAQIALYNPPPNPAKMSDSRAARYVARFGTSSYEADALPPNVLAQIVRDRIESVINFDKLDGVLRQEEVDKTLLRDARDEIMRRRNSDAQ